MGRGESEREKRRNGAKIEKEDVCTRCTRGAFDKERERAFYVCLIHSNLLLWPVPSIGFPRPVSQVGRSLERSWSPAPVGVPPLLPPPLKAVQRRARTSKPLELQEGNSHC